MNTKESYSIHPVGVVHKFGGRTVIRIRPEYEPALLNLQTFSHILVVYWFHQNDTPQKRAVLRVHPRGDRSKPLSGVFATRSPMRPNPLAVCVCELVSVEGVDIVVVDIDAFDGTPVIDVKPYLPRNDLVPGARTPAWVNE